MEPQDYPQFQAPHSPWPKEQENSSKDSIGKRLFEQAFELYAWLASWATLPMDHVQNFQILSKMLKIALVSHSGGHFLTATEEYHVVKGIIELREQLFNGLLRGSEIYEILKNLLKNLTEANAKARLVSHTTDLEYLVCIRNIGSHSEESVEATRKILDTVLGRIKPGLPDINAHAVSQGFCRIIEQGGKSKKLLDELNEATRGWI
jgi:hypothetical protein